MTQIAPGKLAYDSDLGQVYAIVDLDLYSVKAKIPEQVLAEISGEGALMPDEIMEIANRYADDIAHAVKTKMQTGDVDADGAVRVTVKDLRAALEAAKDAPPPPHNDDESALSVGLE
jgi:hypothetical protein